MIIMYRIIKNQFYKIIGISPSILNRLPYGMQVNVKLNLSCTENIKQKIILLLLLLNTWNVKYCVPITGWYFII